MEFCDLQLWDELNPHSRGVTGLYHCLPIILYRSKKNTSRYLESKTFKTDGCFLLVEICAFQQNNCKKAIIHFCQMRLCQVCVLFSLLICS